MEQEQKMKDATTPPTILITHIASQAQRAQQPHQREANEIALPATTPTTVTAHAKSRDDDISTP